jgi:hypothetical protein
MSCKVRGRGCLGFNLDGANQFNFLQGHFDLAEKMPDVVRLVDLMK